ncbi:MAG TPA: helix-turn-helix domain-containing protein [Luteimonas sp.]|nr:helix-turn-helix domain-containing protein [Luteimonas sp.]
MKPRHTRESCTPVREILSRVGDKWSILVIMLLSERAWRFNELKRSIEGMSQRMLTLTLRNLERDGLVTRTVYPTVPPSVEYALTPLGESLCGPVSALGRWAQENSPRIDSARDRFDATAKRKR